MSEWKRREGKQLEVKRTQDCFLSRSQLHVWNFDVIKAFYKLLMAETNGRQRRRRRVLQDVLPETAIITSAARTTKTTRSFLVHVNKTNLLAQQGGPGTRERIWTCFEMDPGEKLQESSVHKSVGFLKNKK